MIYTKEVALERARSLFQMFNRDCRGADEIAAALLEAQAEALDATMLGNALVYIGGSEHEPKFERCVVCLMRLRAEAKELREGVSR